MLIIMKQKAKADIEREKEREKKRERRGRPEIEENTIKRAMGRSVNMVGIMVILVAALIQSSGAQTTHTVGDATGWMVPPSPTTYSTWAAAQTFNVGDILVFNYTTGSHNVAEVTSTNFDSCSATGPISLITIGPTNITLNAIGQRFFICTFGQHCSLGQKVAINVTGTATPPAPQPSPATPPPAPTPTPTPTPSPPPSMTPPMVAPSPVSTPPPSPSPSPSMASAPSPSGSSTPPPSGSATPPPSGSATPPPSGTDSPPPPPPPNGSGPSLAVAALPVTLLSIAMALFY